MRDGDFFSSAIKLLAPNFRYLWSEGDRSCAGGRRITHGATWQRLTRRFGLAQVCLDGSHLSSRLQPAPPLRIEIRYALMLRTIISLCALLAALFFVFRGIQESSAKGETPPQNQAGGSLPNSYQQLILQRARSLQRAAQDQEPPKLTSEAFELVVDELELQWKLLELLVEGDSIESRMTPQPIEPAYTRNMAQRAKVEAMLAEPFAEDPATSEPAESDSASPESNTTAESEEPSSADSNNNAVEPAPAKRQLTRSEQILSNKIRYCLNLYRNKMEMSAGDKNCWEFMHTMIGYGIDNHVWVGRNRFNTIGYLCWNGKCKGFQLFENIEGELQAKQGYGVQGHHGQFLAMLAQHRVAPTYTIKAGDQDFTIQGLIEFEKQTCIPKSELTFKLIALTHYLDSDATWTNEHGQWSIPRLIQEEIAQPVIGSACGGTHRLMGLSYAARYREKRGEPMTGEWQRAKEFIESYHDYAFNLQNRNGSFSTKWFEGRADNRDTQRYQETSGHITEWLAYSLSEEQLHQPNMIQAVNFVADLMIENRDFDWKIGPRGHAIRALALYHERAYGQKPVVQYADASNAGRTR